MKSSKEVLMDLLHAAASEAILLGMSEREFTQLAWKVFKAREIQARQTSEVVRALVERIKGREAVYLVEDEE